MTLLCAERCTHVHRTLYARVTYETYRKKDGKHEREAWKELTVNAKEQVRRKAKDLLFGSSYHFETNASCETKMAMVFIFT